jgi:hypothetical protein
MYTPTQTEMRTRTLALVRSIMTHDNACDKIVPSDLRMLVAAYDERDKRVTELEAAMRTFAARFDTIYGDMPPNSFPGPPNGLTAEMRLAATSK